MKISLTLAGLFVGILAGTACAPHTGKTMASAAMPENFLDLVNYADAGTVRGWQNDGVSYMILDVRTEEEFSEDGHAPSAVLHSYYLGEKRRPENINFLRAVADLYAPEQKILVMCSHGMRATQAAWELSEKVGFSDVHVFPGGYEGHHMQGYGSGDGWKAAGLPVVFPQPKDTHSRDESQ